jgi:hypothetical protein
MCYTATDSLAGYIINSISSILLYNISSNGQFKVMALFLLFVGQMQIFDFIFWKNQNCNILNKLATKFAIGFNHLQPIMLFILQSFYGFKQSTFSLIIFILYLISGIFYNIEAFNKVDCTLDNGVMKWDWNHLDGSLIYYFFFVAYLFLASFNFKDNLFKIIAAIVTLLTILIAHKTPILNKSVGRIWCYYAAFMPLLFMGLYYYSY